MSDQEPDPQERPRPRVVDKRVSARPPGAPPPEPARPAEPIQEAAPAVSKAPPEASGAPAEEVWTPEQEEEARRIVRQIAETPGVSWVVNAAMSLIDVAGTKLELGQLEDAQLAIDALAGLLNSTAGRLENAEQPLRSALAQLQLAYTERAAGPPAEPGQPT